MHYKVFGQEVIQQIRKLSRSLHTAHSTIGKRSIIPVQKEILFINEEYTVFIKLGEGAQGMESTMSWQQCERCHVGMSSMEMLEVRHSVMENW